MIFLVVPTAHLQLHPYGPKRVNERCDFKLHDHQLFVIEEYR